MYGPWGLNMSFTLLCPHWKPMKDMDPGLEGRCNSKHPLHPLLRIFQHQHQLKAILLTDTCGKNRIAGLYTVHCVMHYNENKHAGI